VIEGLVELHGETLQAMKHTPANLRKGSAAQAREKEVAEEPGRERDGQRGRNRRLGQDEQEDQDDSEPGTARQQTNACNR
jgi:hypothetical protein